MRSPEKQDVDACFALACSTTGDINEHMPTLARYAAAVEHVTEFGVRAVCSSWAFLSAARNGFTMRSYDIVRHANVDDLVRLGKAVCDFEFIEGNTLDIAIEETDLLFIDTLHTYKQLLAELQRHSSRVRRYIILHDTSSFGDAGEDGTRPGLRQAVREFCVGGQWRIEAQFPNNNGLTVLTRK